MIALTSHKTPVGRVCQSLVFGWNETIDGVGGLYLSHERQVSIIEGDFSQPIWKGVIAI